MSIDLRAAGFLTSSGYLCFPLELRHPQHTKQVTITQETSLHTFEPRQPGSSDPNDLLVLGKSFYYT